MKYKSVIAIKPGGPEILQVIENELRAPVEGEARIKVLAAAVCRPTLPLAGAKHFTAVHLWDKSFRSYQGTPLLVSWMRLVKALLR